MMWYMPGLHIKFLLGDSFTKPALEGGLPLGKGFAKVLSRGGSV